MMEVLIVEDETAAFENLQSILREVDSDVEIMGNTESIEQTIKWLREHPTPDLIFMDIHLSDGSAFSIFQYQPIETPIIFTTAYDQYAIEAFRVNSIDYLLKPIDNMSVKRALDKFRRFQKPDIMQYLSKLSSVVSPQYTETLLVPLIDCLQPIRVSDVACFYYTSGEKTQIILKNGETVSYVRSLDSIYQSLNPMRFYRANKQFIIERDAVENILIRMDSRLLVVLTIKTPESLYISKNRAAEFKKWLTGI